MSATAKLRFAKIYEVPDDAKKPAAFAIDEKSYDVTDIQGDWIKIQFNSAELWGKAQDFTLSDNSAPHVDSPASSKVKALEKPVSGQQAHISKHLAKLRTGPDEQCKIITFLFKKNDYQIVAETDNYYRIQYKDTAGYILKNSCSTVIAEADSEETRVPVAQISNTAQADISEEEPSEVDPMVVSSSPPVTAPKTHSTQQYRNRYHSQDTFVQRTKKISENIARTGQPPREPPQQIAMNNDTAVLTDHSPVSDNMVQQLQSVQNPDKISVGIMRSTAIFMIVAIIVLVNIVVFIHYILTIGRSKGKKRKRQVVIVGEKMLNVKMSLLQRNIPVDKFFELRGYTVKRLLKFHAGGIGLIHSKADIVLIDWKLRRDAIKCIEQLQDAADHGILRLCLFYGVSPKASKEKYALSAAFHFTGDTIKINDLAEILKSKRHATPRKSGTIMSLERYPFQGEIEEDTLSEMLQFILITKKTGTLFAENKDFSGIINFHDGTIVHSETRSSQNQTAIREILDMKNGTFRFEISSTPLKQTTQINVMNAMMEWAQIKDEKIMAS
ncbi:MAG: DUF4388 domain-containing protein [Chitinivibrionales bacterium]|nr:DUF4388 domain-containing protein [Chitinivibrionales bacterium]